MGSIKKFRQKYVNCIKYAYIF